MSGKSGHFLLSNYIERVMILTNLIYMEKEKTTLKDILDMCNKGKVTNRMRQRAKAYQKKLNKTEKKKLP